MKKRKYRALMLDLDGTSVLNGDEGLPSDKVVEAIKKARQEVFVGIATGRPYYHARHIMEHLELSGPCIVNNGAQIVEGITGEVLHEQPMRYEDILRVHKAAQKLGVSFQINTREKDVSIGEAKFFQDQIFGAWVVPSIPEKKADSLIELVSHISTIAVSKAPGKHAGESYIVMSHTGATKQHGILEAAKMLGISTHDIIGVGDGDNDFPLLMACGLRVAMGNAVEGLKEIADYIAPTVWDDGVVDVINRFILN